MRPIHRIATACCQLLERHNRRVVQIAMLGVLVAGLLYVLRLGSVIRFPDERVYLVLAGNLAHRRMFSLDGLAPTTLYSPGWPFFSHPGWAWA